MDLKDWRLGSIVMLAAGLGALAACTRVGWLGETLEPVVVVDDGGEFEEPPEPEPSECATFSFLAEAIPANLLLTVDTSGSMAHPTFDGGTRSKLADTQLALNTLLDAGDGLIRFGFLPFPEADTSCTMGSVAVDCGDDSVAQIRSRIAGLVASGGTPTGAALSVADAYAPLHEANRPSFVALLTDGLPTCPNGDGTETTPADQDLAVQAVATLRAHGIDTFVIGLGEDLNASDPALLNAMADAGGRARLGSTRYYQANSLGDLTQAFDEIGGVVMGCSQVLDPAPPSLVDLRVSIAGAPVDRDASHVDGWDYDPQQQRLTFYGASCAELQGGDVTQIDVVALCLPEEEPPAAM